MMDPEVSDLITGKQLEDRKNELDLTYEEIGQMVGVGKSTVRKWFVGGIKNMGRDKIAALANALQISPLEFIDHDPEVLSDDEKDLIKLFREATPEGRAGAKAILMINVKKTAESETSALSGGKP